MTRRQLLRLASALVAALPVTFGLIRAVSTGDDVRYLWLAAAAFVGANAAMALGRDRSGLAHVSRLRALGVVAGAAACAAATALLLGGRPGAGVAIVSFAFGLCSGAGALLAALARQEQSQ